MLLFSSSKRASHPADLVSSLQGSAASLSFLSPSPQPFARTAGIVVPLLSGAVLVWH